MLLATTTQLTQEKTDLRHSRQVEVGLTAAVDPVDERGGKVGLLEGRLHPAPTDEM